MGNDGMNQPVQHVLGPTRVDMWELMLEQLAEGAETVDVRLRHLDPKAPLEEC